MIKKPAIPAPPKEGMPRDRFDSSVKETLEILTGRRGDRISLLSSTATTAQIIDKINELLDLMQ